MLIEGKYCVKKLWQMYKNSSSVIYKIRRMSNEEISRGPVKKFNFITNTDKAKLLKELKEIVWNINNPFSSVQAAELVDKKLRAWYNSILIRRQLKEELNWSFKKVKPKSSNIDLNREKAMR